MHKVGRWVLLALFAAFILGLAPTIFEWCERFFTFTESGLGVTIHFTRTVNSIWGTMETYAWHITLLYAAVIAFVIFMEGQNPDRTILWMLALVFVPVFGVLLYLVIGPDLHGIRRRRSFRPPKAYGFDCTPFSCETEEQLFIGRMLHACSGAELLMHNRVKILINGDETFPALEASLASAQKFIHMEFFIVKNDELGQRIGALLKAAARRGVKVRLLYDAVGSWKLKRSFVKELEEAGVDCRSFMPVALPIFRRQMNFRNHRKIVVIDGNVAFTGGLNLGDEYEGKGPLGFWRDTFVRIDGEAIAELHKIFAADWRVSSGAEPAEGCDAGSAACANFKELPILPMQVVSSGVDSVWHSISKGYYAMISRAKERAWITSPYLVPGPELMNAMVASSLSGVDVRVMIPSTKDHFLVYWGSRSNIEPLLRAGVRVFLYQKGFIHAKTLLSDCCCASVGTCNMDVRSLDINFENQLFIYDRETTEQFAAQFERDMKDCLELTIAEWERRPMRYRVLESFGRLYSAQI